MIDKYHLVSTITTREAADKYFDYLIVERMKMGYNRQQADRIETNNIAQFSGGWTNEIQERVKKLFGIDPVQSLNYEDDK